MKKKLIAFCIAAALSGTNVFGAFIDIDETVKVVFTQETIGPDTVTVATVTVREVVPGVGGTITVRSMVQKLIPDGANFNEVVTQTTYVATSAGGGNFNLETTTTTITTPIVAGVRGTPVEVTTTVNSPSPLPEVSLGLPPSTELFPIDEELDDPVVISPL